jgi:hypothetical protein
MSDFFLYVFSAFWPKWWPVVTVGSLLGIDAFVSAFWPWGKRQLDRIPHNNRVRIEVILLFVSIFYAGFAAWDEEHTKWQQEHDARLGVASNVRHINNEDRIQLITTLRKAGGSDQSVEINSASNCDECEEYAQELREVISSIPGWKATGGTTIFGTAATRGIWFFVLSLDGRHPAIMKLASAFEAAHLKFEWAEDPAFKFTGYQYSIFVASQVRR